ncbi:hypothetical protein M2436_006914 [Streptomyces sp. HB372]|nr:hypothetical protein [Streptomyces sp. HB372]
MTDIGVDVRPDAVADLRRIDGGPRLHLVQRLRLDAYGLLGGAASLPDPGDGQPQDDRVDHADHHRHVLDDVGRLGRIVVIPDPPVVQDGDGEDDRAGGRHGNAQYEPFGHASLLVSGMIAVAARQRRTPPGR